MFLRFVSTGVSTSERFVVMTISCVVAERVDCRLIQIGMKYRLRIGGDIHKVVCFCPDEFYGRIDRAVPQFVCKLLSAVKHVESPAEYGIRISGQCLSRRSCYGVVVRRCSVRYFAIGRFGAVKRCFQYGIRCSVRTHRIIIRSAWYGIQHILPSCPAVSRNRHGALERI